LRTAGGTGGGGRLLTSRCGDQRGGARAEIAGRSTVERMTGGTTAARIGRHASGGALPPSYNLGSDRRSSAQNRDIQRPWP
jgi:hypothetical protein